jgi:CrcB protein
MLSLAVAGAAGVGAVLRYLVDTAVQRRTGDRFPYGTLLINLTGSLLLGLTTGLALHHGLPRDPALILGAGFAGGYTTLSTWAWETVGLAERRAWAGAALNAIGSFAAGLAVAAAGLGLALL